MENSSKNKIIKFYRDNGYNCFPIKRHSKESGKDKGADYRYVANMKTPLNQEIKENENYGILPILGNGNALIDFDDKERFREYVEKKIKDGFIITETGKGWHLPVKGLTGDIKKIELFNYKVQKEKIIEIQSPKQYVIGAGSIIFHKTLKKLVTSSRNPSIFSKISCVFTLE